MEEILVVILGWLMEFLGELLLWTVIRGIVEAIACALMKWLRSSRPTSPWLVALGYLLLGAAAGRASIWLVPQLLIQANWLQTANIAITPIIIGFIMQAIGHWRERQGNEVLGLKHFGYGFCFAFSMALVRYACGR